MSGIRLLVTYHQRLASSDVVNNVCHVNNSCCKFHETVDSSREETEGSGLDANHLKDLRGKIVETVGSGEFVEQEEHGREEESTTVARNSGNLLEDNPVV